MPTFSYILIALALALETMLLMYRNAKGSAIRPTVSLCLSLALAAAQAALFMLGVWIAAMLRFDMPELDKPFFIAMLLIVAVKLLLPMFGSKRGDSVYDLTRPATMLALAVASSVNALLLGIGAGFVADPRKAFLPAVISIMLLVFMLSWLGIMLGRNGKGLKTKRWHLIAVLMLLVCLIAAQ